MDIVDQMGALAEGFLILLPPPTLQQSADGFVVKPVLDDSGGISGHDGIARNGFSDNCPGSDYGTISQMDTRKNDGPMTNPNVIAYLNISLGIDPARWSPRIEHGRGADRLIIFGDRTVLPYSHRKLWLLAVHPNAIGV